jgi:hypothetical protein
MTKMQNQAFFLDCFFKIRYHKGVNLPQSGGDYGKHRLFFPHHHPRKGFGII